MKIIKTECEGIYRAVNDEDSECYGLFGLVGTVVQNVLMFDCNVVDSEKWMFVPHKAAISGRWMSSKLYDTREELEEVLRTLYN